MRSLIWFFGLAVVVLVTWGLWPSEVAPPISAEASRSPEVVPPAVSEPPAAERQSAVATGSLAVVRRGDGSCELKVEVTDSFGRAVSAATVTWMAKPHEPPIATMMTDGRGFCALRVSPGRLYVRAHHRDVGTSILLLLSTDDQRERVPRLALLRPCEVVGVVRDAAQRPVPHAQLLVQALLGIPRGHAAECVTSEYVQCDENGVFAFEASYGTRGTLMLVGDATAAESQSPFAAGLDEYVVVGPRGVSKVERRGDAPATPATGGLTATESSSKPVSSAPDGEEPNGYREAAQPNFAVDQAWSTHALGVVSLPIAVFYPDGSKPSRLQAALRRPNATASTLDWQREIEGANVSAVSEYSDAWWFVLDPDTGHSAYLAPSQSAVALLHLAKPGELHVHVRHLQGNARGVGVSIEPCGNNQSSQVRSDGAARFEVPVGPVRVRAFRGLEELASRIAVVRTQQRTEVTLLVDLSR